MELPSSIMYQSAISTADFQDNNANMKKSGKNMKEVVQGVEHELENGFVLRVSPYVDKKLGDGTTQKVVDTTKIILGSLISLAFFIASPTLFFVSLQLALRSLSM